MINFDHINGLVDKDMIQLRYCALAFSLALLCGCSPGYQREGTYGGIHAGGYSDERIDQNTVIVRYNGGRNTSARATNTYLLLRSAEVTIENGYDYFVLVNMTTSPIDLDLLTKQSYNGYVTSPPKAYPTYYRSISYKSYRAKKSPFEAVWQGQSPCSTVGEVAIIKMFEGMKPADLPFSYDAKSVIAHLGPAGFN